jgi:hypothetical protein
MGILREAFSEQVNKRTLEQATSMVIACSLTAMFLLKNKQTKLLPSHFLRMLDYLRRGQDEINFASMETASNTFDRVTLKCSCPIEVKNFMFENLSDRKNKYFSIVRSVLKYLNEDQAINSLVAQVTNNGVLNNIIIDSENITVDYPKAFVTVVIDNQYVNLSSSIVPIVDHSYPTGGIGQKDLMHDYGYSAHRKFLSKVFGIDIGDDYTVYYDTCYNNGDPTDISVENATRNLYENVCKRLNDGFNGQYNFSVSDFDFKDNVLTSMLTSCLGVDPSEECECVFIDNGKLGYNNVVPINLMNRLHSLNLRAECPVNKNPSIRIIDEATDNEIAQVRFKKEKYKDNITGHRYKLYFKPTKLDEYKV